MRRYLLQASRHYHWLIITILTVLFTISTSANSSFAQTVSSVEANYQKQSFQIPMRDGTKLYTTVYSPRDDSVAYPILMKRTPYSVRPYGADQYSGRIAPSKLMEEEKYIFVLQDVRGRWMSEGSYDNMRPHINGEDSIDESSDTYDTIEWLLKNVKNNNGKVGMWGISYPGFYTAAALPEHHPALVAASPQAPISDFFFDDFHHHGAYLLSYFVATSTFGFQHQGPTQSSWYKSIEPTSRDAWNFYMSLGPMSEAGKLHDEDNFFWKQIVEHPNYDEFWQKRSILPHLKGIKTNVLTVGGLFDAEDLYGPLNIYREIDKNNPDIFNAIVMGPVESWRLGKRHTQCRRRKSRLRQKRISVLSKRNRISLLSILFKGYRREAELQSHDVRYRLKTLEQIHSMAAGERRIREILPSRRSIAF